MVSRFAANSDNRTSFALVRYGGGVWNQPMPF